MVLKQIIGLMWLVSYNCETQKWPILAQLAQSTLIPLACTKVHIPLYLPCARACPNASYKLSLHMPEPPLLVPHHRYPPSLYSL